MNLLTEKYRPFIIQLALIRALPSWKTVPAPTWLEALVLTESSGNPFAKRYEAHQDRQGSVGDADRPNFDDGFLEDDTSWGLMQVMGYNLRFLTGTPGGTFMDFHWALDPEVNLLLGTRLLKMELGAVAGDVSRALARYNGGPTGDDGTPMRVQPYVDRVAKNCLLIQ